MTANVRRLSMATLTIAALGFSTALAGAQTPSPAPAPGCPGMGWAEGLVKYLGPNERMPVNDTANVNAPDCNFHEWSWETFVWATALVQDSTGATIPRFMTFPTPDELLSPEQNAGTERARPLKLAARSLVFHNSFSEGTGAIVEADGNMLVAQNGYPVYASVHMNPSYFNTAKKNLIVNGGYESQPQDSTFEVGAGVFKATWLRLADGEQPPVGAYYITQAEVPVLAEKVIPGRVTIEPVPGKFVTVRVALIGLHVVGHTENHPEFLWGTFEAKMNSPATADNTFTPSPSRSDPKSYTLYKANTPFSAVNLAIIPPKLRLDPNTQKITPVTNAVLENRTGGENQPGGPGNVLYLTTQAQGQIAQFKAVPQRVFANYNLIGTVWMKAKSYNLKSNQTDAIGSVDLANVTAETFVQNAKNTPMKNVVNCFNCHNPTSYSFQDPPPPKLKDRLVSLSHVLAIGTPYAVPNSISGNLLLTPLQLRR